jgi:hypothetical protein
MEATPRPIGGALSQLNPLSGAILQSITAQREVGVEKERQVRREQILKKNIAAEDDRFEHQVESSDTVAPTNDGQSRRDQQGRKNQKKGKDQDEGEPHIDLTA